MAERLTREEARRRTRGAILDAAEVAFVDRGYRLASLDEIALAAGFTKGAVYSNFASKAELFLALLDRRAERDRTADGSAPPGAEPGWSLATLDFLVEAVHDPGVREALAERYEQARRRSAEDIGGGRAAPPWATWEEVASVAMALGSGLIIQSLIDPEAVSPDLFGRTMARLLSVPPAG